MTQRLTASEFVAELEQLLGMVHRLSPPLNRHPALFLEQKDELGHRIMTLIRRMGGKPKTPTSFCAKQGDAGASLVRVGTRLILVERRQRR